MLVKKTDLCFTHDPNSPVNRAILKIAKHAALIVHYRELALLIPDLQICKIPDKAYSQELNSLGTSIISDDGTFLISIKDALRYDVYTFNQNWSAKIHKEDGTLHNLRSHEIIRLCAC
jgi:hypothetical protein